MPRLACPEQAHRALHIVQRGLSRAACFAATDDRLAYLEIVRESAPAAGCAVHAWVLMGNHVHLLLTPARERGAARLMSAIDAGYARYLAAAYGHSRALWEQPYDATPVHFRRQFLACMRYIEENPVRAGLARTAADYRWSSYHANALGEDNAILSPHPHYFSLGRTPEARRAAYAALFARAARIPSRGIRPGDLRRQERL
jgi:putative transposase